MKFYLPKKTDLGTSNPLCFFSKLTLTARAYCVYIGRPIRPLMRLWEYCLHLAAHSKAWSSFNYLHFTTAIIKAIKPISQQSFPIPVLNNFDLMFISKPGDKTLDVFCPWYQRRQRSPSLTKSASISDGIVIILNWFEEVWDRPFFRPGLLISHNITTLTDKTTTPCPYKEKKDVYDAPTRIFPTKIENE